MSIVKSEPLNTREALTERLGAWVDRHLPAVFLSPTVAFLILMMAFPIVFTLWLAFQNWIGGIAPAEFVGLENFRQLIFEDPRFWDALGHTFSFTALAVGAQVVIGVGVAHLLHREFVGRGIARSVFLLPMIATPVAVALVWRLMFQPDLGILNDILASLGFAGLDWTASQASVIPALALVDTWEWTSFIALIVLAGLSALPEWPYEAALVDGANGWQTFWHVTLPMVRPVIIVAAVFRLIEALKTFDLILVVTGGGPGFASETMNVYAYRLGFQYQRLGYSAALLIVFFLIILGITALLLRFRKTSS